MIYSPHLLQKKVSSPLEEDEFGRIIPGSGQDSWEDVCLCRCDDNTTKEFTSPNGSVYRPNYHIVCEKQTSVKEGDEIRCMDGTSERCMGKVYMAKLTNFFGYSEIWI